MTVPEWLVSGVVGALLGVMALLAFAVFAMGRKKRAVTMEAAIRRALSELGVPNVAYPAPVANAVKILQEAVN